MTGEGEKEREEDRDECKVGRQQLQIKQNNEQDEHWMKLKRIIKPSHLINFY